MGVVIALLLIIALTLLLDPGAVWNLIVWLSIGALLLCVGVAIILLYQAYPREVIAYGVLGGVGFLLLIVWMVAQEQHEQTRARKKNTENRIPLPLFPQVIKTEQELIEQCYAVFYRKGETDDQAAQVSRAIEQSVNRDGHIVLAGGCKKRK